MMTRLLIILWSNRGTHYVFRFSDGWGEIGGRPTGTELFRFTDREIGGHTMYSDFRMVEDENQSYWK